MDWKNLILQLMGRGLTQAEIAAQCGVYQSAISAVFTGARGKRISWDLGEALLRLERETRPVVSSVSSSSPSA